VRALQGPAPDSLLIIRARLRSIFGISTLLIGYLDFQALRGYDSLLALCRDSRLTKDHPRYLIYSTPLTLLHVAVFLPLTKAELVNSIISRCALIIALSMVTAVALSKIRSGPPGSSQVRCLMHQAVSNSTRSSMHGLPEGRDSRTTPSTGRNTIAFAHMGPEDAVASWSVPSVNSSSLSLSQAGYTSPCEHWPNEVRVLFTVPNGHVAMPPSQEREKMDDWI
jgi:hypothetical protein